jgi:hypothetical protein
VVSGISHGETNVGDRDRNKAQIRDLNADALVSALVENPNRDNANPNAVAVKGSPSIEDAKNRAEKSENQSGDGCYERECLHGVAMPSNY